MYEAMDSVVLREAGDAALLVLLRAAEQIAGHAHINASRKAGHYVHVVVAFHISPYQEQIPRFARNDKEVVVGHCEKRRVPAVGSAPQLDG